MDYKKENDRNQYVQDLESTCKIHLIFLHQNRIGQLQLRSWPITI